MLAARSLILGAGIALTITVPNAGLVLAQSTGSKALAEQLFEQGRELAKTNKWAEACSKFEASLRYDVALGTRLNLATCYEKTGKLASAWAMFRDSAALASRADDAARRDYALQQAMALVPRLPELTIAGPTSPPAGFAVTRDGLALDLATLGIALYVDPGSHVVTASAPGFEQLKATVTLGEAESESLVIRELRPVSTVSAEPQPQPPEEREDPIGPSDPGRTRRLVGLGLAGGGVVLAGAGLLFGVRARSTFNDARALCGAELTCEDDASFERGKDLVSRARTQATFSTVLVIAGATAAAAGAVVWATAPKREHERAEATIMPIVTNRDLGVAITGSF